jgi:hypothetical protein
MFGCGERRGEGKIVRIYFIFSMFHLPLSSPLQPFQTYLSKFLSVVKEA